MLYFGFFIIYYIVFIIVLVYTIIVEEWCCTNRVPMWYSNISRRYNILPLEDVIVSDDNNIV